VPESQGLLLKSGFLLRFRLLQTSDRIDREAEFDRIVFVGRVVAYPFRQGGLAVCDTKTLTTLETPDAIACGSGNCE
jgi:hypothetical protein